MTLRATHGMVLGLALLALGCGGGGGSGGSSSTAAAVASAGGGSGAGVGSFVVTGLDPETAPAATTPELVLSFSAAVDLASVRPGSSLVALEDTDTNPGGAFAPLDGDVTLAAPGQVAFAPRRAFRADREVRLVLTSGVRSAAGEPLSRGPTSTALSVGAQVRDAVHEVRFAPTAMPSAATPPPPPATTPPATTPPPTGATPPGVRPSVFRPEAGTDVWHIDFDTRAAAFEADLERHGLRSGDAATDRLARDLVVGQALSWCGQKYGRSPRGEAVAGQSWKISFTSASPGGTPGRTHSREVCGGRHDQSTSILGVSIYDPGNQGREDNAATGRFGIFPRSINGSRSTLDPALTAADRRFLDGTYVLGAGSAADDARSTAILRVAADWGHAVGAVVAHEVGHSVGLPHDESDPIGLMKAATGAQLLSNTQSRFSGPSAARLDANLGKQ